jgi:hypothetical protein
MYILPQTVTQVPADKFSNTSLVLARSPSQKVMCTSFGTGRLRLSLDPPGAHGAARQHHREHILKMLNFLH